MSKTPIIKNQPQVSVQNRSIQSVPHKSGLPSIREVTPPALASDSNTLVAYKDLSAIDQMQLQKQKYQMYFAFGVFGIVGLIILMAQIISKPRMVASSGLGYEVQGVPTHSEHYQYDKNCYKGDNGEQVCVTRTSRK